MGENEINKDLMAKFLAGECTTAELEQVRNWVLAEGDEHPDEVEKILRMKWELTDTENPPSKSQLDQSWHAIGQKIDRNFQSGNFRVSKNQKVATDSNNYRLKIAAVMIPLLLALGTLFFYTDYFNTENVAESESIEFIERTTQKGQRLTMKLPDGSQVTLNAASHIRFPKHLLKGENREIFLEGEAFFDVKKVDGKKFTVYTGNLATEVLGTSFNVNAYPFEEDIKITLVTGKVKVSSTKIQEDILMKPMDVVEYDPQMQKFDKKELSNIESIYAWKNGELVLDNNSFEEIIQKLELWYGVEFIIDPSIKIDGKWAGKFKDKNLEFVLKGLGFSSQFNFEIKDKLVFLNPKK